MAQLRTRLNISDFKLPLISDDLGNTSFVSSYDQQGGNEQPMPIG